VVSDIPSPRNYGTMGQRISAACKAGGYPEPEWQEPGMCTRVIFRPHPEVRENISANVGVNVGVNDVELNERQRWFILRLAAGGDVNSDDLKKHWEITIRTAERDITGLRKKELIEFVGAPKIGRYQLKRNA